MPRKSLAVRLYVVVAALLFTSCGGAASSDKPSSAQIEEEVSTFLEEWAASFSEGRFKDAKALYAAREGFVWIERGRITYQSAADLAAGLDQLIGTDTTITNALDHIKVEVLSGDSAAFSAALYSQVVTPSFEFTFDGVMTGVAIKEDGGWRLYQGHLSQPPYDPDAD